MTLDELKVNAMAAVKALIEDQTSAPQDVYNALAEVKEDIDTALEVINDQIKQEE